MHWKDTQKWKRNYLWRVGQWNRVERDRSCTKTFHSLPLYYYLLNCLFHFILVMLHGMCDISSPTKGGTQVPCIGSESESRSVVSDSLRPRGLHSLWNPPGQNTGVGSLSLLQGIFLTQGLNPCLPHCRRILHQLSHKGSPRVLEWVAYPFSRGSSRPRNRTGVSRIAGRFFTIWATREAIGSTEP